MITLNEVTRELIIPKEEQLFGVTSDERSSKRSFTLPRYTSNNMDLAAASIRVNYINAGHEIWSYAVPNVRSDEQYIYIDWIFDRGLTKYAGTIAFVICCIISNGQNIDYEWNTAIARGKVVDGIETTFVYDEDQIADALANAIRQINEKIDSAIEPIRLDVSEDGTLLLEGDSVVRISNEEDIRNIIETYDFSNTIENSSLAMSLKNSINTLSTSKADKLTVYTKTEIDTILNNYSSLLDVIKIETQKNGISIGPTTLKDKAFTVGWPAEFPNGLRTLYEETEATTDRELIEKKLALIPNHDYTSTMFLLNGGWKNVMIGFGVGANIAGWKIIRYWLADGRSYTGFIDAEGTTHVRKEEASSSDFPDVNYMTLFRKVGIIGDSLSSGEIAMRNDEGIITYHDMYDQSWLAHICRTSGTQYVHYSKGGLSAKTWLNDSGGKRTLFENDTVCNAYFIALGTNDMNDSYAVGSVSDSTSATTHAGYLKTIIELVRQKAPNCVIFLMSMYSDSEKASQYTAVQRQIAALYSNVFFVPFSDDIGEMANDYYKYTNLGHYTAVGYILVADRIKKLCNRIIENNMSWFKYFSVYN